MMERLRNFVESRWFQGTVLCVICLNSVLFGLQTSSGMVARFGACLENVDRICLSVFVVELLLKIIVYNRRFCNDPWNIFDFFVVAVSFAPDMGMFSSVRLFRVLRVFKLISGVRHMRIILAAIVKSIPGILWASLLLVLIYYVYGILATNLFGKAFPQWFGTLGESLYSLFQIMTLESWSMGIARPVIAVFPWAWIFFVSYILCSSFVVMNIVVGIVLNSIGDSFRQEAEISSSRAGDDLRLELAKLREQLEKVEQIVDQKENE